MSTTAERLALILDEFIAECEAKAKPEDTELYTEVHPPYFHSFKYTRYLLAKMMKHDKEAGDDNLA